MLEAKYNGFNDKNKGYLGIKGVKTDDLITLQEWAKNNYVNPHTARLWVRKRIIIGFKFKQWYVHKDQPLPPGLVADKKKASIAPLPPKPIAALN